MNQAFSKILITIIILIFITGGILAYQYFWAPKEKEKAPGEEAPEKIIEKEIEIPKIKEEISELEKELKKILEKAISTEEVSLCKELPEELYREDPRFTWREMCYASMMNKATAELSTPLCLKLPKETIPKKLIVPEQKPEEGVEWTVTWQSNCAQSVLMEVRKLIKKAKTTRDEFLCEKIPPTTYWLYANYYYRGACYQEVAIAKKEAILCEKVEDRSECYREIGILTDNPDLCEKIKEHFVSGAYKDYKWCIYAVAVNTLNIDLCNQKIEYGYYSQKDMTKCEEKVRLTQKNKTEEGLPDLVVDEVKITPESPKISDQVWIEWSIKNIGTVSAYKFNNVDYRMSCKDLQEAKKRGELWGMGSPLYEIIAPGEIISGFKFGPPIAEKYGIIDTFCVKADGWDEIKESNEINNYKEVKINYSE